MIATVRGFRLRESFPRMIADFILVHVCMFLALWIAIAYEARAEVMPINQLFAAATKYYIVFCWALSPCFPVVFLLCGFYTRVRSFDGKYKPLVLVRGIGLSLLIYLALNYLGLRRELVARIVALSFSLLLIAALILARYFKSIAADYFGPVRTALRVSETRPEYILVLGGAGYLGSILVRKLLASGRKVRVLDNLTYGDGAIRTLLDNPNFELIVGDCRSIQSVVSAVKGVQSIIDLAAIVGDPACEQDRKAALEINYAATRMLIEIAKGNEVNRLIFASSCSVYGAADHELDETSPVQPISLYAQTKVDSEQVLLRASSSTFHPTVVRLATVFGHSYRPRFDLVVNLLTAKAKQDGVITIYNREQWRPFIHVDDVARAFLAILEAPTPVISGEIFNVGDSDLNHTLGDIAERVRHVFPEARIVYEENTDRRNYRVSFDKFRNYTGFRCTVSVAEGIQELKEALNAGVVQNYKDLQYSNVNFLRMVGSPSYKDETGGQIMAAFAGRPDESEARVMVVGA